MGQTEDLSVALTCVGLLWNISGELGSRRGQIGKDCGSAGGPKASAAEGSRQAAETVSSAGSVAEDPMQAESADIERLREFQVRFGATREPQHLTTSAGPSACAS
jgi:hypothetical protein